MTHSRMSHSLHIRPVRVWLPFAALFGAVSAFHLVSQLLEHNSASSWSQILLLPSLMLCVLMASQPPRTRLVRLLLLAQFFSWMGDALPRFMHGDAGFLTMVVFFLAAQVVFVVAFAPYWRTSVLRFPLWLLVYAFALGGLIILCGPHAGVLLTPVIFYGLALTTMAVMSTGLGWLAGVGGAIFFVSDSLIALRSFGGYHLPAHGFLIMLTYIAAQAILAWALVRYSAGNGTARPAPTHAL